MASATLPVLAATHLIWEAAGRPGATMGTRNTREIPLMHRADPLPCFWCGFDQEVGTPLRVSDLRWHNFTDWPLARRKDSGWLCAACLFAFKDRSLRFGHWVASPAGLVRLERQDPAIRSVLMEPPSPPFAIGVCQPGESKHMAVRAKVNHDRDRFWVQYGDEAVWVNRSVLQRWSAALAVLTSAGASSGEVRFGRYRSAVRQAALPRWDEAEGLLAQARQSGNRAFDLCLTSFLAGAGAHAHLPDGVIAEQEVR